MSTSSTSFVMPIAFAASSASFKSPSARSRSNSAPRATSAPARSNRVRATHGAARMRSWIASAASWCAIASS